MTYCPICDETIIYLDKENAIYIKCKRCGHYLNFMDVKEDEDGTN